MADVNKVKGNITPPEPDKAKEKGEPDVEQLREKWAKVGKVDPDQKKERKPKAQQEAETREKQIKGKKPELKGAEPSIFEPKAAKAPPPAKGAEAPPPPPAAKIPQAAPSEKAPQEPPSVEEKKPTTPAQKRKRAAKKKAKALEKKAKAPPTETKKLEKAKETLKKTKAAEIIAPEPLPPPPLAQGAWEATGKETDEKEKKKVKEVATPKIPPQVEQPPQQMPQVPAAIEPTPPVAPLTAPFAHLPPQVQQLFEKMIGVMTVMTTTGVQQTTIHLDNPQFEKSVFYRAEIVITEFSTAPKAFNIELRGSENAINLFAQNSQRILDEIEQKDYNFTVNRIDTSYLLPEKKRREARPVRRKKST